MLHLCANRCVKFSSFKMHLDAHAARALLYADGIKSDITYSNGHILVCRCTVIILEQTVLLQFLIHV